MTVRTDGHQVTKIKSQVWSNPKFDDVVYVTRWRRPILREAVLADVVVALQCLQPDSCPVSVVPTAGC